MVRGTVARTWRSCACMCSPSSSFPAHSIRAIATSPQAAAPSSNGSPASAPSTSSFAVVTSPSSSRDGGRRLNRNHGRPRSPRERFQTDLRNEGPSGAASNALYHLRTGLANQDLDAVWQARQTLVELNQRFRIGAVEANDILRLIVRVANDKRRALRSPTVDPLECAEALTAESLKRALATGRSRFFVPSLMALISLGKSEMALEVINSYFDKAGFHEQSFEADPPIRGSPPRIQDDENLLDADTQNIPNSSDADGQETSSVSDPRGPDKDDAPSRPLNSGFVPPIVYQLIPVLVHLHVMAHGDISRMLKLLRHLPHPDRTKLLLVHSPKAYQDLFAALDAAHASHHAFQGKTTGIVKPREASLHIAELIWGLRRPEEEIGRDPISRLVGSLAAKRHFDPVGRLLDAFIVAVGRNWIWMQDKPRSRLSPPTPDISQNTWAVIIAKLLSANQTHLAIRAWDRFHALQLPINAAMYNALILGYSNSSQWDAVSKVWSQHSQQTDEGRPDKHTYNTMMSALFKSRNPSAALSLFDQMKYKAEDPKNPDRARVQPDVKTYNVVLHGLLLNDRNEDAMALLRSMWRPGAEQNVPKPETTTLNTMMRSYSRSGDLPALSALLTDMQDWPDVQPDIVTFTTVLDALIRHGPPKGAGQAVKGVSQLMKANNVRADTVTWSALIKALLSNTGSEGVRPAHEQSQPLTDEAHIGIKLAQIIGALHGLKEMLADGVKPNEVTLGSLIQASAQFQRYLEGLESRDVDIYGSPILYEENAIVKEQLKSLKPWLELGETMTSLEHFKKARVGTALATSFFDQMKSKYEVLPNRKSYHFVLEHSLKSFPTRHPHRSVGWIGELEATRISFTRGLAILDEFCTGLFLEPLGQGAPVAEGVAALRLPAHLQEPLTPLRPLTPRWKTPSPNAALPALPNTLSMKLLLRVLCQRMEVFLAIRDSPIYEGDSSFPAFEAVRTNIDNQIALTHNALGEMINRYNVWHRMKQLAERDAYMQGPYGEPDASALDLQQSKTSPSSSMYNAESGREDSLHLSDSWAPFEATSGAMKNLQEVADRAVQVYDVTRHMIKNKSAK